MNNSKQAALPIRLEPAPESNFTAKARLRRKLARAACCDSGGALWKSLNFRFRVSVVYRPIASGLSLLLQKVMKNSKLKKHEGKVSDLET